MSNASFVRRNPLNPPPPPHRHTDPANHPPTGYFHAQMEKAGIPLRKIDLDVDTLAAPTTTEIDELAEKSQSLEQRVSSLNESYETLKKREVELTEWRWVLREAGGFFDRAHGNVEEIRASTDNDDAPLLADVEHNHSAPEVERSFSGMNIGFVAGVIARDRVAAFERILWRTLRGNLYMNQAEIPEPLVDPTNNEPVQKNVFVIFAHGKEILAKIRKISESMSAEVYNVDENSDLRRDQVHEVNARLNDVQNVLRNTQQTLEAELTQISRSVAAWMVLVGKEKAVYNTLNNFSYDRARRTLIAEGWCPTHDLPLIRSTLQDVTNRAGLSVPSIINEIRTNKTPPTYLKTNKFTEAFQTIVNAYGTATYQEVNPAIPVIVTFPFLFAVMFGDFGHACIMLAASLAMIYWEKPLKKVTFELFAMVYYGRYIALVMSVFSIYTGLIYNDVFSKSMTLFDSQWRWKVPENWQHGMSVEAELAEPNGYRYPFGLDWRWHDAENDLLFSNSYKMKMSIILGWAHMTYSLCFSYINARHFKKPIDIWGNFVPGMIFFQSIFGYLVGCIIYKWTVDWKGTGQSPPGLLNMLIYMFLQPGTLDMQLYRGQATVQVILLLLAFAQVPVLLFLKPFYLRWEHNRARAKGYRGIGERSRVSALDDDEGDDNGHAVDGRASEDEGVAMITQDLGDEEHEEFEFGEVMIHQVIHTIGTYWSEHVLLGGVGWLTALHRVLPQLRLAHGLVSPSLGAVAGSSAAVGRALEHDDRPRPRDYGHRRRHLHCRHVYHVLCPQLHHPHRHGGCVCHGTSLAVPDLVSCANNRNSFTRCVSLGSNRSPSLPNLAGGRLLRSRSRRK